MTILGLHHITIVAKNAQRTVDFYTRVLGFRLVKQTVNFDDPGSYHLYFGDETGTPGTAITFFEWPNAPQGAPGIGGTHHLALRTADGQTQRMWKRRLTDLGIGVEGPLDRSYFTSIYFRDPDGMILEIATEGPGWTVDEPAATLGSQLIIPPADLTLGGRDAATVAADTWPEPVPAITPAMSLRRGMHHITAIGSDVERTDAFFGGLLGMRRLKKTQNYDQPGSAHWYWGTEDGAPGTLITYFHRNPAREPQVQMGAGQTHHFALRVADEATQIEWRERLVRAMLRVSPVMDRVYFKSIYTSDPDGHIVEIATDTPGFLVDEDAATLGTQLQLPPWLEQNRLVIGRMLTPLTLHEEVTA